MNKINLITADTGPLIHLAIAGQLDLLRKIGVFHIPDLVLMEAIVEGKPGAEVIKNWLIEGVDKGYAVISKTDTGEAVRLARLSTPDYRMKNGGERAILDWLIDEVSATESNVMVVYENGKVPNMITNHNSDLSAVVLTTKSFLIECQRWGIIENAEQIWKDIENNSPNVNSKTSVSLHGRLAHGGYEP